ncbi:MAG TPA: hypothetical protein VGN16_15585 [Acidobacteriaceae bacterium]|jgi:hypothetical protein
MDAVRALLSHAIDYAGLFPPASLDLSFTVRNYAEYRRSQHAWALGRLILPVDRVAEFATQWPEHAETWPIALLSRDVPGDDWHTAAAHGIRARIIETRPLVVEEISAAGESLPSDVEVYVEVGSQDDPCETVAAIATAGLRAKIRTGGIQSTAIPMPEHVARFIACCVQQHVPFKATAGLHHAMRGAHPLTYEAESERATMHGFLNVMLATAWLVDGGDMNTAVAVLGDGTPQNFHLDADHVCWRDWTCPLTVLQQMRTSAMVSFGSCSFTEPVQEMLTARFIA